jgi:hypothetical protein
MSRETRHTNSNCSQFTDRISELGALSSEPQYPKGNTARPSRRFWLLVLSTLLFSVILFSQALSDPIMAAPSEEEGQEEELFILDQVIQANEERQEEETPLSDNVKQRGYYYNDYYNGSKLGLDYPSNSDYNDHIFVYAPYAYSSITSNPFSPSSSFPSSSFPSSSFPSSSFPSSSFPSSIPFSSKMLSPPAPSSISPEFASTPPPPPPLLPPLYASQLMQSHYAMAPQQQQQQQQQSLTHSGQQPQPNSEESHEVQSHNATLLSPWFPSVPASDCQGTFEFTVEGIVDVEGKKLKNGSHKVILKIDAAGPDSIKGELWIDKKKHDDKGYNFDVEKTFNNCRVVTAQSSVSQPLVPQDVPPAPSGLLGTQPAVDHTSTRELVPSSEELVDEAKDNSITLHKNSPEKGKEKIENDKKAEIAALK